ncbi:MAG: hypothetical protein PHC90_04655 [Syntrophorhabdaceae bacterium]|nr:hypothetical protein [Syntrophorhabdaceae bacterium]
MTWFRRNVPSVSPQEVYYYKTKSGREVDFILRERKGSKMLVQVSESLAEPQAKKREIAALTEAMAELDLRSSIMVTRNDSGKMEIENGTIVSSATVIPHSESRGNSPLFPQGAVSYCRVLGPSFFL